MSPITLPFVCNVLKLEIAYAQEPAPPGSLDSRNATKVQLQTLSGSSVDGYLNQLTNESVSIAVKSGKGNAESKYSISEVATLKFNEADSTSASDVLKLSDGSIIRCRNVTGKDNVWNVNSISGISFTAKPSMLSSLQFGQSSKTVLAAMEEKVMMPSATDEMLIVRPGDTIDRIPGVILGVDDESVSFSFDGQTIPAPKTKLAGLFWAQPAESSFQPTIRIKTLDGSRWEATSLSYLAASPKIPSEQTGPIFSWKLRCGAECECPARNIASIDYSNAIVRWLASIPVLETKAKENPYLKTVISGRAAIMAPHFSANQEAGGTVDEPSSQNLVFPVDGYFEVRVPEGVSNFRSRIVRPMDAKIQGDIRCEILSNDEVVWSNKGLPSDSPWTIELPVKSDRRLKFVVSSNSGVSLGSMVTWIQPRFSP